MKQSSRFWGILSCLVLSGMAGLIYETAWTQQLGLVFGASELAVAAVLSAYMGGLTLGAMIAASQVHRIQRPVRLYALLELGVALSALAVPTVLRLAGELHVWLLGRADLPTGSGSLGTATFYLVASFVVLAVPTSLMGATLPLLAQRSVDGDRQLGPRVAFLYAANTVGAAAGAILAAFLLLPRIGLWQTQVAAATLNLVVFAIALFLARGEQSLPADSRPQQEAREQHHPVLSAPRPIAAPSWILPLILLSGFVSFTWEVLWTRLLSHLLGGSIYAFGLMLATFLVGIALGSAVASRFANDPHAASRGFALTQIGIALTSLAAFAAVDRLPGWLAGFDATQGASVFGTASVAALILLPSSLFFGATFPLAVRVLASSTGEAGRASGLVLGWNTLGAIAGSTTTGFLLLPTLQLAGTAYLAVASSLTLSAVTLARIVRPASSWLTLATVLGLITLLGYPPQTPWRILRSSPLTEGRVAQGELAFYGLGRSATVLLLEEAGEWRLTTNGLPEAAIQPRGARPAKYPIARWLSLLPSAARPDTQSMLVVGFGGGVTLEEVPSTVEEILVVELEPEVIAANRALAAERRIDPLSDPRLSVHIQDARSALTLSQRRFDSIVSQPSHPWTAGASHLFTQEFFALARDQLTPEGVLVQWIGLEFVDELLIRSLVATLLEVFPEVEVYAPYPQGAVLFLASAAPLDVARTSNHSFGLDGDTWRSMGIMTPEDILVSRVLTSEAARRLAQGAPLNTDNRNLLQTRSPRILRQPLGTEAFEKLLLEHDPGVALWPEANGIYVVRRLLREQAIERARRVAENLSPSERRVALALVRLAVERGRTTSRELESILETTGDPEALSALVLRHQRALSRRDSTPLERWIAADSPATTVVEGWRRQQEGLPATIRDLEPQLAVLSPTHPLFVAATYLRIAWRQASGDPLLAAEAIALLDPLIPLDSPTRLGLRLQLAVLAQDIDTLLATGDELSSQMYRRPRLRPFAGRAIAAVDTLPGGESDPRVRRLQNRLKAFIHATSPEPDSPGQHDRESAP